MAPQAPQTARPPRLRSCLTDRLPQFWQGLLISESQKIIQTYHIHPMQPHKHSIEIHLETGRAQTNKDHNAHVLNKVKTYND